MFHKLATRRLIILALISFIVDMNGRREVDCEHVKPYEHWGEMHSFEGSIHIYIRTVHTYIHTYTNIIH